MSEMDNWFVPANKPIPHDPRPGAPGPLVPSHSEIARRREVFRLLLLRASQRRSATETRDMLALWQEWGTA